ncbi:hypothetical protein TDB9533_02447 [Thalassocella blandensis]|nr:hypothetical protein TDB9533_02447 [Thalassocella blandensis]
MKKGYWIVQSDVSDFEQFKEYLARTPAALAKYQGKVLIKAGNSQVVEGTSRPRNTVIEFPSYEQALACWQSTEYQAAREFRLNVAELDIVVIEGTD